MKNGRKIKVLAYCDSPTCATGFGTVSRNIFEGLYRTGRYEIDILGINYWGDPHNFPYRVYPTGTNRENDPYGRKKVCSMIPRMEYDILFFLQDTFILDFLPELMSHLKQQNKIFKSICYFPVDSILKEQWAKNVNVVDYPVAYCEFGKHEALKAGLDNSNLSVISHGVNTSEYFPVDKKSVGDFRKRYFGQHNDKFVFTDLNRNQQRKDIPRTIQAFREFRKQVPESLLYLHMAQNDQGWNLPEVCKSYGLSIKDDVVFPENFGPNQGYPREVVNMIYNISDCIISTCLGEGMGLCVHPDTNVYVEEGIKKISDVTIKDRVLSSNGEYNNIEAIMSRDYDDNIYEITTWLSNIPIRSSSDHGFLIYENGSYIWKKAKDLNICDVLLFPKKKEKLLQTEHPVVDRKYAKEKCDQNSDYLMFPIKKITQTHYKGKLIDIQVRNTNDFVAENVVVHNSWIEGMAAKTPVIMPDNTAMSEFITEDRGYLVDSGTNPSLFTCLPHDNEVIRPLVDVDHMVEVMLHVYNNYEEAKKKAEAAYNWVHMKMDWQSCIVPYWVELFDKVYDTLGVSEEKTFKLNKKTIKTEEV